MRPPARVRWGRRGRSCFALLATGLLAACVGQAWVKPGTSPAEARLDAAECAAEARALHPVDLRSRPDTLGAAAPAACALSGVDAPRAPCRVGGSTRLTVTGKDLVEAARGRAFEVCLAERGYSVSR